MMDMVRTFGMERSAIIHYRDLVYTYHPGLNNEKVKKKNKA